LSATFTKKQIALAMSQRGDRLQLAVCGEFRFFQVLIITKLPRESKS